MRRALRKAGWALTAAAGVGISSPAVAQAPVTRVIGPAGQALPAGEVIVLTEGAARLEEGQVELALLADPLLFSYGLGAHVEGDALEVRGFVPTAAVREQALRVAREQTALRVTDKMKLHPTLASHASVDRPENIQRTAKELLEGTFPGHGKGMDVKADARGRVTVAGTIGSYEDKVLASRKLRQVPGCSCVVNQLSVAAAPHDVRPAEPAPHAPVSPPTPGKGPVQAKPAVNRWEPPSAPAPSRPAAPPPKKEGDPPVLGMPRVHSEGTSLPPPAPMPELRPLSEPPSAPKRTLPPLPDVTGPKLSPPVKAVEEGSSGKVPPGGPSLDLPPVGDLKPAPAVKLPEVVTKPSAPAVKPAALPPAPASKAPGRDKPAAGGGEESYVAEGTITFGDDPPPTPPAVAMKSGGSGAKLLSSPPGKPAEGTLTLAPPPLPPSKPSGPVALSAPPVKPPAPPAPAPFRPAVPPAVRLKERIQGICGPACSVQVVTMGRNSLQVKLTAPSEEDGRRLMKRIQPILDAPEFAQFEIDGNIDTPKN